MHIPDGFVDLPTSVGAATLAATGVGVSLKRAGRYLQDHRIALTGLVAAFIFALQMLNFPVAAGTSGHLLGGALAVILVGPWLGTLAVTVVLMVQALLFADGGVTALGLNVVNMALVTGAVGWLAFRGLMQVLPKNWTSAMVATFSAGLISVVAASLAFVVEYVAGGRGAAPIGAVFTAMVGTHFLIGLGEGLISAATVGAVAAARPGVIAGTEGLLGMTTPNTRTVRSGVWGFATAGLVVAAVLVLVVAPLASSQPDGLERLTVDQGIAQDVTDGALAASPLAGYRVSGVQDENLGIRVSGLLGIGVTFVVGLGIVGGFAMLRKRNRASV